MSGPTLRAWGCLLALVLLPLVASGGGLRAAEKSEPLSVFAAASLKESLDEAAAAYQKASGQTVRVS